MSGLYPSLEDMKVDQLANVQMQHIAAANAAASHGLTYAPQNPPPYSANASVPAGSTVVVVSSGGAGSLYPSLEDYMGMEFTPAMVQELNKQVTPVYPQGAAVAVRATAGGQQQIAPITGNSIGLARAEIKQGVRPIVMCKDQDGKIGLRVRAISKGIFVAFVYANGPAALAGLRFGDQILQINEQNVAGWDTDKAMKVLKNAPPQRITMAVRDRPFERSITLQKDSNGTVGFVFKDNKITAIVKDSSAARNGVLVDHHLLEVDGQNVVGLKEVDIKKIFSAAPHTVTITVIPSVIYDHIIKSLGSSLLKKHMDHSIPDV